MRREEGTDTDLRVSSSAGSRKKGCAIGMGEQGGKKRRRSPT